MIKIHSAVCDSPAWVYLLKTSNVTLVMPRVKNVVCIGNMQEKSWWSFQYNDRWGLMLAHLVFCLLALSLSLAYIKVHQFIMCTLHSSHQLHANQRCRSPPSSQSWYPVIDPTGMKGLVGYIMNLACLGVMQRFCCTGKVQLDLCL